jgi:hypothetical protein
MHETNKIAKKWNNFIKKQLAGRLTTYMVQDISWIAEGF